jgi:glutathione synthase/RimK-type ligase-like ATP-grasp enzyme
MNIITNALIHRLKKYIPSELRGIIRRYARITGYDEYQQKLDNPYANDLPEYKVEGSKWTIGIVMEKMQCHKSNITACREMGVSFKLLDIYQDDWIDVFQQSGCDAFLVWPSASLSIWKDMFDDRCRILEKELGYILCPSCNEIWLYENKRRTRDWLKANQIQQPKTWIFYDEKEALAFARKATLPLVYKTNIGATNSGVWILRKRQEVELIIKKTFSKGVVPRRWNPMDRHWGVVYLQEYLPDVIEWRMVRVGQSYFCRLKEKIGDFHSGSGKVSWAKPSIELLELTKRITEKGNFSSMDIDIFKTKDGKLVVNEMHAVFGEVKRENIGVGTEYMGKYIYNIESNEWEFISGFFYDNACANMRLDYLINDVLPSKIDK